MADHQTWHEGYLSRAKDLERATGYGGIGDRIGQIHPDQIIHQ